MPEQPDLLGATPQLPAPTVPHVHPGRPATLTDLLDDAVAALGAGAGDAELEAVNDAVAHAAANAGPFAMTVLRPDRLAKDNGA